MIKLYTDAAVNKNFKTSSAGIIIIKNKQQYQFKFKLNTLDNHLAEFEAAILGFKTLINNFDTNNEIIMFFTDSKIIKDSLNKQYAKHYQPQVDELIKLNRSFNTVITNWIPEKLNQGAHNLAIQGLK
ncbi:ribonuclease HI family protein [Lentilactobacillus laojiaonis]|uniref:ribonuclease HI family protein n=1 Tax=Lentilactobacillus laojiaonis TaxID=2883998 RepID=UPI001D09A50C|nr:ribonuclease HI family protein [Lentilactobacillus laojiaonis]UDM32723.1 ribonuclease HI family protein [Lentilactobacillus laojiaonis]